MTFLVTFGLSLGVAAEPPIKALITAFDGPSFWYATRTSIEPVGTTGRYKTITAEAHFQVGCQDLLQSFQERALQVMRDDGYIDQYVFSRLMDFASLGIEPRQLTLISLYSDLSAREVHEIFGPRGVPQERLMAKPADVDMGLVRVNRGSIYIARGFDLGSDVEGKTRVVPKPLPWELDETLPYGLKQKIDRRQIPFPIEVGRAHAEDKPLPGSLALAVQLASGILANDFRTMKVDPKRALITAHFLDTQHTRLFTKLFPLRILNAENQSRIEEARAVPDNYLEQIAPASHAEWSKYNNTVVYGSLAKFQEHYPLEKSSYTALQLMQIAPQALSGLEAHGIYDEMSVGTRDTFDYVLDGFGRSRQPVFVRDFGTALLEQRMGQILVRRGFEYMSPLMLKAFDIVNDKSLNELDNFGWRWVENSLHAPVAAGRENAIPGIYVSNFDPSLVEKAGILFPTAVLLSVADHLQQRIEDLGPEAFRFLLKKVNEERREMKLPFVNTVDFDTWLQTYPICLNSEDSSLQTMFRQMGGQALQGLRIVMQVESGPQTSANFGMQMHPALRYCFGPQKIRELRRQYPTLAVNARQRLRPGVHNLRMKLLNSASF